MAAIVTKSWSFVERRWKSAKDWMTGHKKTTGASVVGMVVIVYLYRKFKPAWVELRAHLAAMEKHEKLLQEQEAKAIQQQLQRNFDENQRMCSATLRHGLRALKKQIEKEFNLDEISRQIKQNDITKQEKLQLWTKLKVYAICRFFLWMFGCCVSNALASVQFTVIGRYAYVEQKRPADQQAKESMQQFCNTNKQYMSRLEYVTTDGFVHLSQLVEQCVVKHTESLLLRSSYSPTEMIDRFSNIYSDIIRGLSVTNGDAKLLKCMFPEPTRRDDELVDENDRLEEMCEETRKVIECCFESVMTSCYDIAFSHGRDQFKSICSANAAKNGGNLTNGNIQKHPILLPKMIPLIVRSYSRISEISEKHENQENPNLIDKLSKCPDLIDNCKVIFFPMDDPGIAQTTEKPHSFSEVEREEIAIR